MTPEQKPIMEEIYSDKVAHWFYGQIGSADIREDVLAAMKEWERISMKERDEEIAELKNEIENLGIMLNETMREIDRLNNIDQEF